MDRQGQQLLQLLRSSFGAWVPCALPLFTLRNSDPPDAIPTKLYAGFRGSWRRLWLQLFRLVWCQGQPPVRGLPILFHSIRSSTLPQPVIDHVSINTQCIPTQVQDGHKRGGLGLGREAGISASVPRAGQSRCVVDFRSMFNLTSVVASCFLTIYSVCANTHRLDTQDHILGRARMRDEVREVKPGLYLGT